MPRIKINIKLVNYEYFRSTWYILDKLLAKCIQPYTFLVASDLKSFPTL